MRAGLLENTSDRPRFLAARRRRTSTAWITFAPAIVLTVAACGPPPAEGDEPLGVTAQPIYGGQTDDDGSQNAAVVALQVGLADGQVELCSGALVATNVVLTARHCVSVALTDAVTCDASGASGEGDQLGADVEVGSIAVFTGAAPDFEGPAAAHGRAIFHAASSVLCNADLALVVLDQGIAAITPLAVRLDGAVEKGEALRVVGYGENDRGAPAGTRFRRDGVDVLAVGEAISASGTPLGSHELEVGVSICQGDSGGPAISEATGAIVGVASRGGACTDDFGHVLTSLGGFGDVFAQAFAMAGGSPTLEPSSGADAASAEGGVAASTPQGDAPPSGDGSDLHGGAGASCAVGRAGAPAPLAAWIVSVLVPSFVRARRRRRAARRAS